MCSKNDGNCIKRDHSQILHDACCCSAAQVDLSGSHQAEMVYVTETSGAAEEFSVGVFTPCGEAGCYGVAHWHGCCAGISAWGVAGCVTSGAIDPLQSDSYPQSCAALHLSMQAHTHIHTLYRHSTMLCEQWTHCKECFQCLFWCVSGTSVCVMPVNTGCLLDYMADTTNTLLIG